MVELKHLVYCWFFKYSLGVMPVTVKSPLQEPF